MSEIKSAENSWRANGAGFRGNGCVGHTDSPCRSEGGTGRSWMGNKGSPVSRVNTKMWPDLVTCATASIFFPLRRTVTRLGGGQVAVPQIMMHELEMPHAPAGGGVQGQQAVGVNVLADAIAAPKIKRRRTGGDEDHSPLFVHCHARPAVRATDVLPGVGRPGLVTRLARIRNRVERPDDLAGARVVSADVPGRGRAGTFGHPISEDEKIAIDDARRCREHEKRAGVTA